MDHATLIKKLVAPAGFSPPRQLAYDDITATAISRADLEDDVRGINASISLIQQTRGGGWPEGPVTEEHNYVDLVWHELEFREGISFTYAVHEDGAAYLGCCYLYPMGRRTDLTDELIEIRRGRQLVGDARRLRPRVLREGVRGTPPVAGRRVPVLACVLLEPRDPAVAAEAPRRSALRRPRNQ